MNELRFASPLRTAAILIIYVVGSKVSLNPLVAVFSLLLFGKLWGLSGLILALPVTAICKIIFDTLPGFKAVGFLLGKPQRSVTEEVSHS